MTSEFCKASCFAEMYERYCDYSFFFGGNPFLVADSQRHHMEKFGYHLQPNERELNYADLLQDPYARIIFQHILPIMNETYVKKFMEIFFPEGCYGLLYQSLVNPEKQRYVSYHILQTFMGTTGLAAGNTIEEALVQACSEFYERIAIHRFYTQTPKMFYYLNRKNINPELQECLNRLEQNEHVTARIYDLSYTFNVPTCLLLVRDANNHLFHMNFGAAPVIDIAIERCITEIYQGGHKIPWQSRIITRPKDYSWKEACRDQYGSSHNHEAIIIPEYLLLNSEQVDSYNTNIFLGDRSTSNTDLLEHIKKIDKLNNINFYWNDISLGQDIKAVSVMTKNVEFDELDLSFNYLEGADKKTKDAIINTCANLIKYFKRMMTVPDISQDEIEQKIEELLQDVSSYGIDDINDAFDLIIDYLNMDLYATFTCKKPKSAGSYYLFICLLFQKFADVVINNDNYSRHIFQAYWLTFNYFKDGYDKEAIKAFLEYLNYRKYIDVDSLKLEDMTPLFLIKKIFFDELYRIYNSQEYQDFIQIFDKE